MKGIGERLVIVVTMIVILVALITLTIFYPLQPTTPPLKFECGEFEDVSMQTGNVAVDGQYNPNKDETEIYNSYTGKSTFYDGYHVMEEWRTGCYIERTNVFLCDEYMECIFVNDKIVECREKQEDCYRQDYYQCPVYQEVEKCTNNLSIAYCDGSPDECNERHISFDKMVIWCGNECGAKCGLEYGQPTCYPSDNSQMLCQDECLRTLDLFQCVEWDTWEELSIKPNICTRSELRCQGSVEECDGRYA